jgi:hypothetical protein
MRLFPHSFREKIKKSDFNSASPRSFQGHLPACPVYFGEPGFVECPRFFRGLSPAASRTSLYSLFSALSAPNCSSICFQISNPHRQSSIINLQQPPRLLALPAQPALARVPRRGIPGVFSGALIHRRWNYSLFSILCSLPPWNCSSFVPRNNYLFFIHQSSFINLQSAVESNNLVP